MGRFFVLAALAIAAILAPSATQASAIQPISTLPAHTPGPVARFESSPGEAMPRTIAEHQSEPGESKEEFLLRLAAFQRGWTHYNGAEACGVIARKGDTYSVITQTIDSQVECGARAIYAGWENTGETIHSHPEANAGGRVHITPGTRRVSAALVGRMTHVQIRRHQFSEGDYASGCGYLVDHGALLYQCGKGTERHIGDVPAVQ
jgi:hypothetical protein